MAPPPEFALEITVESSIHQEQTVDSAFSNSNAPLPRLNTGIWREPAGSLPVLPGTDHNASSIEANFPHIAEKLILVWGYAECFAYLSELIIDNRGNRMGFDREVMNDLMLLLKITEHVTPDKWTHAPGKHR